MTISAEETATRLLPCPFCGAPSHRVEIPTVDSELGGDPNAGGSYIECTRCAASSAIHFDRKENLESSWNERIDHSAELKELFESAKAIIRDCASALGNGAFVSPECSDEFHAQVPTEIAKCVSALRVRIAALEAQLAERDEALKPFARLASHYMMHEIADTPAPSNDYIFSVTHFARPEIGTISAGDIRRAVHAIRTRSEQEGK